MSEQRARIAWSVLDSPGIHFNALVRRLDLAPGQVQHHLKRLRAEGDVVEERLYGRTHYYPAGFGEHERRTIAMLRRETARDVLLYLADEGPARPADVAEGVDIARSTLSWHLDRLVEQGLVEKRREGNRVTLAAARPEETVRLLSAIEPTLPGRLVDRFERLVDRLLAE